MKKILLLGLLFGGQLSQATGGYDNGSPVGKDRLQLDFTLNPGDMIDYGQTYITWNYGLTDTFGFHGYASHEANGVDQVYYGFKYTFFQNEDWDLSTATGFRHRLEETHIYLPQLLYTYKLSDGYDIGGSIVNVYDLYDEENLGVTFDIAFRVPFTLSFLEPYVESTKFAFGAFKNASNKTYPTYSIDVKF